MTLFLVPATSWLPVSDEVIVYRVWWGEGLGGLLWELLGWFLLSTELG